MVWAAQADPRVCQPGLAKWLLLPNCAGVWAYLRAEAGHTPGIGKGAAEDQLAICQNWADPGVSSGSEWFSRIFIVLLVFLLILGDLGSLGGSQSQLRG